MSFSKLQRTWHELGEQDPLWAILTRADKRGRKWKLEEFFQWGVDEIRNLLSRLDAAGVEVPKSRALDFGCGVGRLTQALCAHFNQCVGVNVAPSMITLAKKYNQYGDRCQYVVNELSTLFAFPDNHFDLIYSNIVLQHIPSRYTWNYLEDFLRVLAPGGILVFQLPTAPRQRSHPPAGEEAPAPLGDALSSRIETRLTRLRVPPGSRLHFPVTVHNDSARWWVQADEGIRQYSIALSALWLDHKGHFLGEEPTRLRLPDDVPPHANFSTVFSVPAPLVSGNFILDIDLVQEDVSWFKERGGTLPGFASKWMTSNQPQPEPPLMEMHGIPRDKVVALLQNSGARVLLVNEDFWATGWYGFRYYVTKC